MWWIVLVLVIVILFLILGLVLATRASSGTIQGVSERDDQDVLLVIPNHRIEVARESTALWAAMTGVHRIVVVLDSMSMENDAMTATEDALRPLAPKVIVVRAKPTFMKGKDDPHNNSVRHGCNLNWATKHVAKWSDNTPRPILFLDSDLVPTHSFDMAKWAASLPQDKSVTAISVGSPSHVWPGFALIRPTLQPLRGIDWRPQTGRGDTGCRVKLDAIIHHAHLRRLKELELCPVKGSRRVLSELAPILPDAEVVQGGYFVHLRMRSRTNATTVKKIWTAIHRGQNNTTTYDTPDMFTCGDATAAHSGWIATQ